MYITTITVCKTCIFLNNKTEKELIKQQNSLFYSKKSQTIYTLKQSIGLHTKVKYIHYLATHMSNVQNTINDVM